MKIRSLTMLAAALAASACDKQPAGPPVDAATLPGKIAVHVDRDAALGTPPQFVNGNGVRVNLFRLGDSIPMRFFTTDANGNVTFVGLAPGTYVVAPQPPALSTITGRGADTITIAAGDTTTKTLGAFQVRLGSTLTGLLSADFFNQQALVRTRFPNVTITVLRQRGTSPADSGFYDPFATVTTDATGTFSLPVSPGPTKYRLVFDASQLSHFPNDTLLFRGSGTVGAPRGTVTFTISGGAAPGATVTQNLTFQFPTRITGAVFRDVNNDSTKAATEGLVSGDTIGVQLRDATGQRVIATASVRCGLTSSGATQTCLNATYTFSSLQGGTYKITVDRLTTKFAGAAPPAGFVPDTLTIVLPTSAAATVTANLPIHGAP